MCGIAGFIGRLPIREERVSRTLSLMKNRGPDNRNHLRYKFGEQELLFLHSRLSILDLDDRSNQPFEKDGCSLVFNGEIYNFVELREELKRKGHGFTTESDTEVLLTAYLEYGDSFVEKLEGMWAFALVDHKRGVVLFSRDRFGEKPLYLSENKEGLFFGSEVKFISSLAGQKLEINEEQLLRYLVNGYKSLYKTKETFYKGVFELPPASLLRISKDGERRKTTFWTLNYSPTKMSEEEAILGIKERFERSLKIRLRSDVPLAFCLSGGIDSGGIVSAASKVYGCDVSTYSIIDPDPRYNERDLIEETIKDLGCRGTFIELKKERSFERLKDLIEYHDAPLATISYYIQSFLLERMSQDGFKVSFSGTAADEMFTGYYDHFNLFLHDVRNESCFERELGAWNEHLKPVVRNPYLQDPELYLKNPDERRHIYLNREEFVSYLKKPFREDFFEEKFTPSLLRNRMMNELLIEATPVILHEDDLNAMRHSIENRSPFLDSGLVEFCYKIPTPLLIKNGYGKWLLRESLKGVLNDKVRLSRQKKGFNASIMSVFDLSHDYLRSFLLDDSPIYSLIDRDSVVAILERDELPNSFSKFLFNFINAKLFLEVNR